MALTIGAPLHTATDAQHTAGPLALTDQHRAALIVAERVGTTDKASAYSVLQALGLAHDTLSRPAGTRYNDPIPKRQRLQEQARQRAAENPSVVPHGTISGYDYWSCRCIECSGVRAEYDHGRLPERRWPWTVPECGSVRGAQAHYRAGQELCPVCRAWSAERHAKTRTAAGARCGTASGAQMHRNLGERICDRCRQAECDAARGRYTPTGNAPGRPRARQAPLQGAKTRQVAR